MLTAYINIGSNLGDRRAHLEAAIAAIEAIEGRQARRSDIVESEPWGYESANRYLNIGIAVDTALDAFDFFRRLQSAERAICADSHRNPDGTYRDRAVDIDLILLGDLVIDTPELTIPHPRMLQRPFVMQPLRQLNPDLAERYENNQAIKINYH